MSGEEGRYHIVHPTHIFNQIALIPPHLPHILVVHLIIVLDVVEITDSQYFTSALNCKKILC